jgi:outer membrane protein assembly factor BamB
LLVLGEPKKDWGAERAKDIVAQPGYRPPFETFTPPSHQARIMAVAADTGECLWKNSETYTQQMMPSTLALSDGRVFFQNTEAVVCLNATGGELLWQAPRPVQRQRLGWSTPTLVVQDNIVYSADRRAAQTEGDVLWIPSGGYHEYIRGEDARGELIAFDATSGKRLWSGPAYEGFNSPVDVLITDGLLWSGQYAWGSDPGITKGRDPKTGEVRRERPADSKFLPRIGHARCHRARATTNYLLLGRRGLEFVDLKTGDMVANFFVRGSCHYGYLPTNGLLYVPPHACACSYSDMLKGGFLALAPKDPGVNELKPSNGQLVRGPAYEDAGADTATYAERPHDWPMYRRNVSRSGTTPLQISHRLRPAWQQQVGSRLTSPVIAEDVLLVAARDSHRVHALDAETGREIWRFVAEARIDSPPAIHRGRALFGSADGNVYCLRLTDGELMWKFRAVPQDRRIVVDGQLESTWPISGSVLVHDQAAFFVAGRTSYLDGGMLLCKLDLATGKTLQANHLKVEEAIRNGGRTVGGHLPDILSAEGDSIFLRSARFDTQLARQKDDVPHIWSPVGFLEASWWHRTYWQYGTTMLSGWGRWAKAGQEVPAGRLLVSDGSRVFGYGRNQYDTPGAHVGVDAAGVWGPVAPKYGRWTFYQLFATTLSKQTAERSRREAPEPKGDAWGWAHRIPVLVQGMVLAGDTLFIAGPEDPAREIPHSPREVDPLVDALESTQGGTLVAVSATDGERLTQLDLNSPPVFDGMAAARSCLYLSTKSGEVVCLAPAR